MKHLNEFIIEKLKITKDNINFDKFNDLETVVIYIAENVINDYTNIDKSDIYNFVCFGERTCPDDYVYHINKERIITNKNCKDLFNNKTFGPALKINETKEQFNIADVNDDRIFIRLESVNNCIREIYFTNSVREMLINL